MSIISSVGGPPAANVARPFLPYEVFVQGRIDLVALANVMRRAGIPSTNVASAYLRAFESSDAHDRFVADLLAKLPDGTTKSVPYNVVGRLTPATALIELERPNTAYPADTVAFWREDLQSELAAL